MAKTPATTPDTDAPAADAAPAAAAGPFTLTADLLQAFYDLSCEHPSRTSRLKLKAACVKLNPALKPTKMVVAAPKAEDEEEEDPNSNLKVGPNGSLVPINPNKPLTKRDRARLYQEASSNSNAGSAKLSGGS